MARSNSPGYPSMSLPKAITAIRKVFEEDRRNPIDRITAAKHIGYGGQSGASDKALSSLAHFGLTEKTGKAEIRVSQLALDILHPENEQAHAHSLVEAGTKPQAFKQIRDRFPGHVSEESLRSYLIREGFQNVAIAPVMNAYFETFRFLEQQKAFESGGTASESSAKPEPVKIGEEPIFGGAKVGDLVQWESGGVLMMEAPMRVRLVRTVDGIEYVAVEGNEKGIPMSEVIVEERGATAITPPTFKFVESIGSQGGGEKVQPGETEWMRNLVGHDTKVRLLVTGDMGAKEIGKLIKLLEAQRAVLSDEDDG